MKSYKNITLKRIEINDVVFGLRQIGNGPDLVFIHGFPTHGYTWRKLIPKLSQQFKCHIIDLPGLGDSTWSYKAHLNIDVQAKNVFQLLRKLDIQEFNLIAHNSGGTIARILAIEQPNSVKNLVLINTEIPNHRPPFIELYQKVSRLPFSSLYFQKKLSQKRFVKSAMGFKQAYSDRTMLDNDENLGPYLIPLVNSKKKIKGAFRFLRGIDWKIIDGFMQTHKKIKANVLLIWGENDKTFPVDLARAMTNQFSSKVVFESISNCALLPHEERPDIVVEKILGFMG